MTNAIFKAVRHGDCALVKSWLDKEDTTSKHDTVDKNNSKVNKTNDKGESLLLIATQRQELEMIKLLLTFGADVNQRAHNLETPFLYAGAHGLTKLVKLFVLHGARFDIFDRDNQTALIPASKKGFVETVRFLVSLPDYPIDHASDQGWTALLETIMVSENDKSHREIIQLLKEAGANPYATDHDGISAVDYAKRRGFKRLVALLESP